MEQKEHKNVVGGPLKECGRNPKTGFFRDGCCKVDENDLGVHAVCVRVTADFLEFSKRDGNDLSTPRPEFGFPGLRPGDKWCVCAARWEEARKAGFPAKIILECTHERALDFIQLKHLLENAIDVN